MVKFIVDTTESIKLKKLLQQTKARGFLYSNSAIKCGQCKVIFPVEYAKCPQCEIDNLWGKLNFQIVHSFGGELN